MVSISVDWTGRRLAERITGDIYTTRAPAGKYKHGVMIAAISSFQAGGLELYRTCIIRYVMTSARFAESRRVFLKNARVILIRRHKCNQPSGICPGRGSNRTAV